MKIFTILDDSIFPHALVESHNDQRYVAVGSGMTTGKLAISSEFDDQVEIESGEIARDIDECFCLTAESKESNKNI